MMNMALIALLFIVIFGLLFLIAAALVIFALWKLGQAGKRLDQLEADVRALRGAPPTP